MTIHTDRSMSAQNAHALGRRSPLEEAVAADDSIPLAAVRRVLNSDRRRAVLRCLIDAEDSLSLSTLVARIADAEDDATAVTPLHDLRQRVHVSLCRTHLPLLEDHRILSYDRGCGLVAPGARLSAFESVFGADLEE
ncbi:DUF7344 domain-containing protein [Haloterrigena alkaliphila]|uniref:DUF7344 domain-containing protein n=1 Tax=Haloterrigena alkaliphila TaxID=2816475 RepID=A0A8A2VF55_9EURY|nr:hypothetical protein [Haloterrigena alkaliphila]QSX00734.1 hypothetical protein J0X25_07185 [Haloterrigena alkaliphila]